MEGEILWGGERQAPRRKGSIQLIYTEKTSILALTLHYKAEKLSAFLLLKMGCKNSSNMQFCGDCLVDTSQTPNAQKNGKRH